MSDENGDGGGGGGYLLFVWSPAGYTLRELDGEPPPIGHEFEDGDRKLVVTKIGPSPLPGDTPALRVLRRHCLTPHAAANDSAATRPSTSACARPLA